MHTCPVILSRYTFTIGHVPLLVVELDEKERAGKERSESVQANGLEYRVFGVLACAAWNPTHDVSPLLS